MKYKTKKRIQGSITVLMIIILLPMMTLSAVIVDSSRINMARSMVSSAGDLTMNTALANYDTILKDVYGLFAMSQTMTDDELAKSLNEYFETTLVSYGVVNEAEAGEYVDNLIGDFKDIINNPDGQKFGNFLEMNVLDDFSVARVENSSLADPDIMRTQIVEYMKYRAPLNFGLSFLDSIKAFNTVEDQTSVVEKQVAAQESTQDVTSACSTLITSIRDYDKLIESIQTGEKSVQGLNSINDGKPVDIESYDEQLDKYRNTWADNYYHINRLNLVFLVNSPSIDSLYLKSLSQNSNNITYFVKSGGSGLNYSNSGINVNVSLESGTAEAKNQVMSTINTLNSGNEKNIANTYSSKDYLNYSYIGSNSFKNEQKAIESFINFEKFALNQNNDVNYNDVKAVLEKLYTLGKYFDNYNNKITAEINAARNDMNNASGKVNTASGNADSYKSNIQSYINSINTSNSNFKDEFAKTTYDFLSGIKNDDNEDLREEVTILLDPNNAVSMPISTKSAGNKSFTNFSNLLNSYKEVSTDSDYVYLKVFKEIVNSSLKNDSKYEDICDTAIAYLNDSDARNSKSFTEYMKTNAGNSSVNNELFKVLKLLYNNNICVEKIAPLITKYDEIYSGYGALYKDYTDKKKVYDEKDGEKRLVQSEYNKCLSGYGTFVNKYQNDLAYYGNYINVAKSVITDKATKVKTQFDEIKSNVDSIIKQLGVIETNLTTTKKAIETYNTNINSWETANSTYVGSNSNDSFSKQNTEDIENSRSQYNLESLQTLTEFVGKIKQEYQDFMDYVTDGTHFKYGNTKVYDMSTADKVKSAANSKKNSLNLPSIVTVEVANSKYDLLYSKDVTPGIEMEGNMYFVTPKALPIQFLKYLNESYPEPEVTTNEDGTTTESSSSTKVKVDGEEIDFDYDKAKNDMKEGSGKELTDDTDVDKYGYSYKSKTMPKGLPSSSQTPKKASTSTFKVNVDGDDDTNVSSGFSSQKTGLASVLSGLQQLGTNTLENTYILSYIFENFSYNTLVQDMVMEDADLASTNGLGLESEASSLLDEKLADYLGKSITLSGYKKNAANNYLYGGEIEYILFGNSDPAKNVTYTKGSIYAIRFAFNSIYAFTNAEIRNTTMSVGLAVQAATCGIVPYQIVQIVLQLALAAAESAIDLDLMNKGVDVVVVKTSDTWAISLKSAVKEAGKTVGSVAAEMTKNAIEYTAAGLQSLVDAGVDEINQSINDLSQNVTSATEEKVKEIVDTIFLQIQSSIEDQLNELQYIKYVDEYNNVVTTVDAEVNRVFSDLRTSIPAELENKFGGNEIADMVLPHITGYIDGILDDLQTDITNRLSKASADEDPTDIIVSQMIDIKKNLISEINARMDIFDKKIAGIVENITSEFRSSMTDYINDNAEEISDEAAEKIKEKVTNSTNDFIDKYLSDSNSTTMVGTGAKGSTSSSVASMIKFGYKEYLMLLTFISIMVKDDPILTRTADLIELNIKNATTKDGAEYQHKLTGQEDKAFSMKNAKTYINVDATVELDMLFMNMEFFTNSIKEENTQVEGDFTPAAKIKYAGLYGY